MTTLAGARIADAPEASAITVRDGRITAIDDHIDGDRIDVSGLTVGPGLIDLQTNGAYGEDFTDDPTSIWRVGARLPEQGVTAFLPTIITSPPETIHAAQKVLAGRPADYRGAEPLGLHLEGPMISPHRPGVHDPSLIRQPSSEMIEGWTAQAGVAMVTLAPELEKAGTVVKALVVAGVVVSAGHSAADYEQAMTGFGWGITAATHLFNTMEPFHHRSPGLIGAVFDHPGVVAGMIVDGIHTHPATVRAAWKLLGPTRLALVTDSMAAAGLGDGEYVIGSSSVHVVDGRASDSNRRLAGSTLTLDQAVRNPVEFTGCTADQAVAAASSVPAQVLGLDDRGRLSVGGRADLAMFDSSMRVAATMVGGEMVWRS